MLSCYGIKEVSLSSLTKWKCDICGEFSVNKENGYVLWNSDEEMRSGEFTIIHKGRCDKNEHTSSMPISYFLGQKGIVSLTSMLSAGMIIKNIIKKDTHGGVQNYDEYVDFFRRLQLPYYEEARSKFSKPELLDDLYDDNEIGPYGKERLKKISEKY